MKCNPTEFKKYYNLVESAKISNKLAAKFCGYTPEHFIRLRKKFKLYGDRIFIDGHCGKPAKNAIPHETKKFIIEKYLQENDIEKNPINFKYFTDELNENCNIKISYKTLYKIMCENNIASPEKHNVHRKKVIRQRFRRVHFGELIQYDATPYQFFKWNGDTKYYTLHGALDDATGTFTGMQMSEFECRYGYIECRRQTIHKYGIEQEDYSDRAPIFHNNYKESRLLDIDEQLEGTTKKIPLWQALNNELKIITHLANSPQAKGKIERAWKTVQGRLVNEFRKNNITNIATANTFLQNHFIDYYNNHFGKKPISDISVFRPAPTDSELENILCVKEKRTVSYSNIISFKNLKILVKGAKPRKSGFLCINERGLFFLQNNKRYEVEIKNELYNLSDAAPQVLEKIIYNYMYAQIKEYVA